MTSSVPGHDLEQPAASLAALFDAPALSRYVVGDPTAGDAVHDER